MLSTKLATKRTDQLRKPENELVYVKIYSETADNSRESGKGGKLNTGNKITNDLKLMVKVCT
jgi:hypothetical protein